MTACVTPVKPRLKFRRSSIVAVPAARLESVKPENRSWSAQTGR